MATGYILVLLVAGVVAAVLFSRLARRKGYVASKAKRYPLLLMVAAMSAAAALLLAATLVGVLFPHWRSIAQTVYLVGNWFVIAMNLIILNKAYQNMKAAPDARVNRATDESDET